ncbi:MAG: preprotein translocase subunit YajC [Elusimicrobia bacterium]|nr:preprotein translocase subunit YajC [Elusimicrobiota bacterium]
MASPPAADGQTPPPVGMSLMPLILIFFVFYFLLIRPQKNQMQKHQDMLNSLT